MDGYETLYYTTGYSIFYTRAQPQPSRGKRSRSQNKGQTWDSFPGIPIIAGSTQFERESFFQPRKKNTITAVTTKNLLSKQAGIGTYTLGSVNRKIF